MAFEFSDQVGNPGREDPSQLEPSPLRSNLTLADDNASLSTDIAVLPAPPPPAPSLEFAADLAPSVSPGPEPRAIPEAPAPSIDFLAPEASLPAPPPEAPLPPSAPAPSLNPAMPESLKSAGASLKSLKDMGTRPAPVEAKPQSAPGGRPAIFGALSGASGAQPISDKPKAAASPQPKPATPSAGATGKPTSRPGIFSALSSMAAGADAAAPVETAPIVERPSEIPAAPPELAPLPASASPPKSGGGGPPRTDAPAKGTPPGAGQGEAPAPPAGQGTIRIGDKLVEMGLISNDQLQIALIERKRTNKLIGTLLVELGFITESALSAVLATSSGFDRFDLTATVVEPELLKRIPKEVAQRYRVFPVVIEGRSLRLAMADIYDVVALDQMRRYVPPGTEIIPMVGSEAEIIQAIDQYYGYEFSIDGILRELETGKHDTSTQALSGEGYQHPLVRLVNAILLDAVKSGASDVHMEPEGNFLRLRYRVDGVMYQVRTIHKDHWAAISHRIKIVSSMNIADKMNPQDGRFGFVIGSHKIDFRVSALPTVHGENIVLRILDKSRALMSLTDVGFSDVNLKLLQRLLKRPEGIIIVTGPTGSGKTTTLYAVLNFISTLERNIMTLEDPVEFEMPLIRQAQVREGTGLNFADGVRAMLRQDPDVIFIGEVRDNATASMALRAAMTGHQVYSTLHTNDAAGAIPRLHDLGLPHGMLAGNIIGIIAQRLVRKVCPICATQRPANAEEIRILGADPANPPMVTQAVGCDECRNTGYKGRVAVHEILPLTQELDEMIISGAPLAQVRAAARPHGFIPMSEDGIGKVLSGVTTIESLMRSVDLTDRM
jgi:general secretion pathway protein E/type IV pilus assembly protein PilB